SVDASNPVLPEVILAPNKTGSEEVRRTDGFYQIVLPLRSKFETVGTLVVYSWSKLVDERLQSSFVPLGGIAPALSFAFAVLVWLLAIRGGELRIPWLPISYAVAFVAMSGIVIYTLVALYADGAQGKVQAMADTLRYRLRDVVEFDLDV